MLRGHALTALVLALVLGCAPAWAQVDGEQYTPGSSCSSGLTAGHGYTPSWDTFFECNGSTQWQRGPYFFGSTGDTCDSNHAGLVQWTGSVFKLCDGTAWEPVGTVTGSCGSPSGLSFTNLTSQSLNTVVTSNTATITYSGCGSAYSVSVTGAATAQISVNGGAWGTSGAISSGQTLQVRMTTSGSVSTVLTATVTVGSSSTNWTTTTRSGSLQAFLTPSTYGGNLGGLSGADALCQSAAGTAGYAGTYMAILSDATTSAASRLTLSYPIVNAYDGSTVAAANLWVGSITTDIKTPGGATAAGEWTGSNADGSISASGTCTSWTTTAGNGMAGNGTNTASFWINSAAGGCSNSEHLYCIQQ